MGLGSTVRKLLLAAPGVYRPLAEDGDPQALVGARVFPKILPQGVTFPAITYQRISRVAVTDTLTAPGNLARPRVQIDAWARTDAEVITVGAAVRRRLNGFRGPVDGELDVHRIALETSEDTFDPSLMLHRHRGDYFVWHEED